MKAKIILFTITIMLFSGVSLLAQVSSKSQKVLVVYYSHSGNTHTIAGYIKELAGADIFRIEPVKSYPDVYQRLVDQAKKEIEAGKKPEIKGKVSNIDTYDVIFVGSPNWWNTIAPPVATFLASYNFSGKTIIPFMTHEGTRMGRTVSDIKKLCPKSTVMDGLPIRGGSVDRAKEDVKRWLQKTGIVK